MNNIKRCDQCGREGIRGFKVLPAERFWNAPIMVCANIKACRKRWPKVLSDDE